MISELSEEKLLGWLAALQNCVILRVGAIVLEGEVLNKWCLGYDV